MSLVSVEDLTVSFSGRPVVDRVSFALDRGETLALVGESGSGKSLTALSLLQLLPPGATCDGRVVMDGQSMIGAGDKLLRRLRGGIAGMVFQEPMTSLNPLTRIGRQIAEAVQLHQRITNEAARARVIKLLDEASGSG
jgi:microcin C transport system ATP-binding protein